MLIVPARFTLRTSLLLRFLRIIGYRVTLERIQLHGNLDYRLLLISIVLGCFEETQDIAAPNIFKVCFAVALSQEALRDTRKL